MKKGRMNIGYKFSIIAFSMFTFLSFSQFLSAAQPLPAKTDKLAPDFKLMDLKGKEVSLSDFKGKPLILFFWTTWCPFCREEFPVLIDSYNDVKKKGVDILAIDIGEPKERVEKFTVNLDIPFPILLDSASTVAYAYDLLGVPTFILIDSQGKIKFHGNDFPSNYTSLLNQK